MFEHLNDARAWIESVYRFGDKYNLDRMVKACEMLGHPERSFASIHIGGTNGKGSTLTYLKSVYQAAGYKVGTYTSPYIVRFNERITYNDQDISDDDLLRLINRIYAFNDTYLEIEKDQISFFELVTLMCFLYFEEKRPEIALIEVGLGGTLDATNVIQPLASVITNIGNDHMHVLGHSLRSIAENKLGIVKPRAPLFTAVEQKNLIPMFEAKTREIGVPLYRMLKENITQIAYGETTRFSFLNDVYEIGMWGAHQVKNAALAVQVAQTLDALDIIRISDHHAVKQGLRHAFWPGRFERFGRIVLDGAHNPQGLKACLDAVLNYYPKKRITTLFAVMAEKDHANMLKMLERIDRVIFTEIDVPRCEKATRLYALSNHPEKHLEPDAQKAFDESFPHSEDAILLITGSLYFISAMRSLLLNRGLRPSI